MGQFADWAALGIHRPITTLPSGGDRAAEVDAGRLPAYVLREKDHTDLRADAHEWVAAHNLATKDR